MPPIVAFTLSVFSYIFWGAVILSVIRVTFIISDRLIKATANEILKDFWPQKKADVEAGIDPSAWLYALVLLSALIVIAVFFWRGWHASLVAAGGIALGGLGLYVGILLSIAAWHGALSTAKGIKAGQFKAFRNAVLWLAYLSTVAAYWVIRGFWAGVSAAVIFAIGGGILFMMWKFALGVVADVNKLFNRAKA